MTIVTVALDVDPSMARPFAEAAAQTHPSVVDTGHRCDELFGFNNVPMAVWIDETGRLVRPAESAAVEANPLRAMEIPDRLDDRLRRTLEEVKRMPDPGEAYRAAIVDWAERGEQSQYALAPEEVVARSLPRGHDEARAAACFELGNHLRQAIDHDAAVPWWREAHRLDPKNWTYKRQAWSLVTTEEDQPPDLLQGPNDVYESNWLDDVVRLGGGEQYGIAPQL